MLHHNSNSCNTCSKHVVYGVTLKKLYSQIFFPIIVIITIDRFELSGHCISWKLNNSAWPTPHAFFIVFLDEKLGSVKSKIVKIYSIKLFISLSTMVDNLKFHQGPVLVKDMQTPLPPSPPQKWPSLHERCLLCWNRWKINFTIFAIFIFELWLI